MRISISNQIVKKYFSNNTLSQFYNEILVKKIRKI